MEQIENHRNNIIIKHDRAQCAQFNPDRGTHLLLRQLLLGFFFFHLIIFSSFNTHSHAHNMPVNLMLEELYGQKNCALIGAYEPMHSLVVENRS